MPADLNYANTFISVADDCPVDRGVIPPERAGRRTIAGSQFALLSGSPYGLTSEDVLFESSTARSGLGPEVSTEQLTEMRHEFFARPRACMRASPLPKRFGWGLHCDAKGCIALYGVDTDDYRRLSEDDSLVQVKAFRTSRR